MDTHRAALLIQTWLVHAKNSKDVKKKLQALVNESKAVQVVLQEFNSSALNLPAAQKNILHCHDLFKIITAILPHTFYDRFNDPKAPAILGRKVATAILVSKFGDQVFDDNTAPDDTQGVTNTGSDLKSKATQCTYWSTFVFKYLMRLTALIAQGDLTHCPTLFKLLDCFDLSLKQFLRYFDEWKALDTVRMVQTLEETFSQSYANLLALRMAILQSEREGGGGGGGGKERSDSEVLLKSAEYQVKKITEAMLHLLGPTRGRHRIEELVAGIESSGSNRPASPIPPSPRVSSQSSNQSAQSEATTTVVPQEAEGQVLMQQLTRLSQLAGINNDRLAHEITFDVNFRLPARPEEELSANGESLPIRLKERLLASMADRLVNSLRRSNLEKWTQLECGMVVPVLLGTECYTVKVVSIAGDLEEEKAQIEVELVAFGENVSGVPQTAFVLSDKPRSSAVLINYLEDLCNNIAGLTPKRYAAARDHLRAVVDIEMLAHMIDHDGLRDATEDLLPRLRNLFRELVLLQAAYRVEDAERWWRDFEDAFYCQRPRGELLRVAASRKVVPLQPPPALNLPNVREKYSLEEVWFLLPLYFEQASSLVEDVQRDAANYYVSLLAPVLQREGPKYLSARFQQNVDQGLVSLTAVKAFLEAVVQPEAVLVETVNDLVEADSLPASSPHELSALLSSSSGPLESDNVVRALIGSALVKLLQLPVRLDSAQAWKQNMVPATLAFDASRLAKVRDIVDKVCIECTLVLVTRQLLQRYRLLPREAEEVELQHRLDALLSDTSSTSRGEEGVNRNTIALELKRYLSRLPSDAKELEGQISLALDEVLSARSPIWQLFQKRIYKILLRAAVGRPYRQKLAAYSLQSPAQDRNIESATTIFRRVTEFTLQIHGGVYQKLLFSLAEVPTTVSTEKN
eukprot:gene1279-1397_t